MARHNLLILILILGTVALILLFLKPCAPQQVWQSKEAEGANLVSTDTAKTKPATKETQPAATRMTAKTPTSAPATPAEVDTAPPVNLNDSEDIPDVAKCVSKAFPEEAKPHVRSAVVTVRLIVDKFGNVRSVNTTSVEFSEEPAEELQPMLRKIFIQAGNRAFGSKKCPPRVINGQNVGYTIDVPLQYRH
jgi:hypothetical protein